MIQCYNDMGLRRSDEYRCGNVTFFGQLLMVDTCLYRTWLDAESSSRACHVARIGTETLQEMTLRLPRILASE